MRNPFRNLTPGRLLALVLFAFACGDDDPADPGRAGAVISGAGDITDELNAFRAALGGGLNTTPGPHTTGRREINWDGVPDNFSAPNNLPRDFFNSTDPAAPDGRKRGAIFDTPGTAVQVSADSDNPSGAAVRFGNINPTYSSIFRAFSEERLFSPIGSNIVDLTFYVPGTNTRAVVRGFGAVYTDVDQVQNTSFEYFDANGRSLGRFSTPVSNNGLSFLSVVFPQPIVHRVRIGYGNTALGPNDGGSVDVAVMDDFIYGEPQAIGSAGVSYGVNGVARQR